MSSEVVVAAVERGPLGIEVVDETGGFGDDLREGTEPAATERAGPPAGGGPSMSTRCDPLKRHASRYMR